MAFRNIRSSVSYKVWQPEIDLDHCRSLRSSSSVQVYIKLVAKVENVGLYRRSDGTISRINNNRLPDLHEEPSTTSSLFNMSMFKNYDYSCQELITLLKIVNIDKYFHEIVADEVVCCARRIGNWVSRVSNMGRKVLPIFGDIIVTRVYLHDERYWVARALRVSAMEFERRRRYGMVPASQSSLKVMLKRVRVGDEDCKESPETKRRCVRESTEREKESCTICLDDFEPGSDALRMPCTHIFHAACIVRWLKESHYCPVCRFKMPTD